MAKLSFQLEKAILNNLLTNQKKLITKKELEFKDLINLQQGRWFTGRSITDVDLEIDSTYREMEEDLRVMIDNWHGYIWLMADTKEPTTEIVQQY